MWERYGFYIIQGLLILLVTHHFQFSDRQAVLMTGIYGALVYISPIIGGYFADKHMGFRYAILFGGFAQLIGYCLIATLHLPLVYLGLSTVILGNGFLKPNIACFLGEFYQQEDPRRHAGFTYYYTLMNIGQFFSTLSAGFIQQSVGWYLCFLTAAAGMFIGLVIFTLCRSTFLDKGLVPNDGLLRRRPTLFYALLLTTVIAIIGVSDTLLQHPNLGNGVLLVTGIGILVFLVGLALRQTDTYRRHLLALVWLILFAVIFWAIFFEMFSVVNLFVDRNVNRAIFGIHVPAIAFISLEPIFIVILGIPLGRLWQYLGRIHRSPHISYKFVGAFLALALAMWLLTIAVHAHGFGFLVAPAWMVLFYLLVTVGEMLLSPNILSAVTEFSPPKLVGMMMGVQFLAIGFGSSITGLLGLLAAVPKGMTRLTDTNPIYAHAFLTYSIICLSTAGLVLVCTPWLKRLTRP